MFKRAILGGTFNPVHWGHLLIAERALDQFSLEQVIWVPARHPLHKSARALIDFEHRSHMVKLAIDAHPQFALSTLENRTYAIDTFLNLQALYPTTSWHWIIGMDAFEALPRWYRRREFVDRCIWLVAPRHDPPQTQKEVDLSINAQPLLWRCEQVVQKMAAEAIDLQWRLLEMPLVGISSGLIRHYCSHQRSIRYWVPDAVRSYILQQNLYEPKPKS